MTGNGDEREWYPVCGLLLTATGRLVARYLSDVYDVDAIREEADETKEYPLPRERVYFAFREGDKRNVKGASEYIRIAARGFIAGLRTAWGGV